MTKTVTYQETVELVTVECGSCYILFALPGAMEASRRETGESFWCPNGCRISYTDTEVDTLRRDLAAAKKKLSQVELSLMMEHEARNQAEINLGKARRDHTRIEKRIRGGACPCCKRTFVQLLRHMKTKHPEYPQDTPP